MEETKKIVVTKIDFKVEKETAITKITGISEDLNALVEIGTEIKVNSPESLVIANQKLSEAKEIIDITEQVRKTFVKGPGKFVKEVNLYVKSFLVPIDNMITYLKEQAKAYQELEIARVRLEQEKANAAQAEELEKEKGNLKKLSRAAVQIHARIFGGSYKTGSNEVKKAAGCITIEQCTNLRDYLAIHYPKHETFGSYEEKSRELMSKFTVMIVDMQKNLKLSESADEKTTEKANKAIIKARVGSEKLVSTEFEKLGTVLIKTAEKKAKIDAKIITAASKGIRKTIVWKVIDRNKIPDNYLKVDEDKINEFLGKHRDEMRPLIEQNEGDTIIKGIEFSIKTSHVSA